MSFLDDAEILSAKVSHEGQTQTDTQPQEESTGGFLDDVIIEPTQPTTDKQQNIVPKDEPFKFRGAKFSELAEIAKGTEAGEEVESRLGKEIKVGISRFAPFVIPIGRGLKAGKAAAKFAGETAGKAARLAVPASAAAGANAGARFVEELSKGESPDKSANTALNAGVGAGTVALGLPLVSGGIKALANKIAPIAKKGVAQVEELLTSIPADDVEFALNKELTGESVFKHSFNAKRAFNAIGKRAQKAVNYVHSLVGKELKDQKIALRGKDITIKTAPIIEKLDEIIDEKTFQGETTLFNKDINKINEFKDRLSQGSLKRGISQDIRKVFKAKEGITQGESQKRIAQEGLSKKRLRSELSTKALPREDIHKISSFKEGISENELQKRIAQEALSKKRMQLGDMHVAKLNIIKNNINNSIESHFDDEAVSKISREGVGVLQALAKAIDDEIASKVPEFKEVTLKYSNIRNLRDRARSKLKNENVERNIKNLYKKDLFTQDLFKELDELAPKGLKFQKRLKSAVVRDGFEQIAPGQGGGSGSMHGFLNNVIRGGFVGGAAVAGGAGAGALAAVASSPRLGAKPIIRGLGAVPAAGRAIEGLGQRFASPLASRAFAE